MNTVIATKYWADPVCSPEGLAAGWIVPPSTPRKRGVYSEPVNLLLLEKWVSVNIIKNFERWDHFALSKALDTMTHVLILKKTEGD